MGLSNAQYDSIIRGYEAVRDKNRQLQSERTDYVHHHVTGYLELDNTVGTVAVQQGKKYLDGDENALAELSIRLQELTAAKAGLLAASGLPDDFLAPVYNCPDCQDTGYIGPYKCHCLRQAIINLLYEQSGISELLANENFAVLTYDYFIGEDRTRFQNAVTACRLFVDNFAGEYQNLFFYGTVGTGKSFLSNCIAKALIDNGRPVIYFSAAGLFDTLSRNSFDYKNKEPLYELHDDLYQCDLLIIDDLGTELTNNFVASQLFFCLNKRHMTHKSTIISTNLSLEELRNRYSERIFSRITSNYQILKLTGPDIRITQKTRRQKNKLPQ